LTFNVFNSRADIGIKMVRAKVKKGKYAEESEDESAVEISSDDDYGGVLTSPPKKRKNEAKVENKAKKSKIEYKEPASDEDFTDAGEIDDAADSDFESEKPKKKKSKGKPAKRKSAANKKKAVSKKSKKGRPTKKKSKYVDDSEEDEEEEEEEFDTDDEIEEMGVRNGKSSKKAKVAKQAKKSPVKAPPKKPKHPEVGEMVIESIKKLRDNPRKGSSLAAIKGYMAEEWGVHIPDFVNKIKKFIIRSVQNEEIIQTKGKGASGRFTVPGMKARKKKRSNKLTKKWDDEPEPEYKPTKTIREEGREKFEIEMEMKRVQRQEEQARKAEIKASLPAKPSAPKKTDWEVEMIKGMKVREGETFFLVKWEGYSKCTWEPEENLGGCEDLIENFEIEERTRKIEARELEEKKKQEQAEGNYEVARILEVKFSKVGGKREFLVRWKGWGPDGDTWEPEENLDCEELIEKFMVKHEKIMEVSEKHLREDRKVVERLNYSASKRLAKNKRTGGFRMTYDDMCE